MNSEVAALKVARRIYDECEHTNFIDKDFGPSESFPDDPEEELSEVYIAQSGKYMYCDPKKIPQGYTDPERVVWKTPEEFLKDEQDKDPKFIIQDASSNEVR